MEQETLREKLTEKVKNKVRGKNEVSYKEKKTMKEISRKQSPRD
jgi:hypothetical protein